MPKFAQRRLRLIADDPLAGADLVGEAERLQLAQASELLDLVLVGRPVAVGRHVDDAGRTGVADELPVELRPALGADLAFDRPADVEVGAGSEFLGDEIARAVAHTLLDVVAGDDEVLAVVAHAAHDQMDVRVLGIPVIDGHPVEPGAEILLHLAGEIAREGAKVRHLQRVVRRDDEPEMVPVVLAPLGEGLRIGVLRLGTEQVRLLAVAGDALAAQVVQVRGELAALGGVADEAALDHGAARAGGDEAVGLDAGALAAPQARAAPEVMRPDREMAPPALRVAASAWATKGRSA